MDYEKKKTEALEELKQCVKFDIEPAKTILRLFPELEESDYVIKQRLKHLLGYFRSRGIDHDLCDMILNWLEKQGEQKPADKIEPWFKVGDWITDGEYTWKVTNIKRLDYILQSQNGSIVDDTTSYVDEHFHLWTIEDAKDGDVLASKNGCPFIYKKSNGPEARFYCCVDFENYFCVDDGRSCCGSKDSSKPATKEQRDFLFSKMKEAGYEWNAEKKELKKIEHNSAWSEEDEERIEQICEDLKCGLENFRSGKNVKVLHFEEIINSNINWLKSLKPQPHWKPTEEQLNFLINLSDNPGLYLEERNSLEELCNNLKKL